jgi:glycosidase
MRKRLWDVIKCSAPPHVLADQFDERRRVLRTIVSSQGEAGKNYVTFLDNHDINERFHQSAWPKQSRTALLCLLTLQGVPCLYYGHEQGLEGSGNRREYARGPLWGYPGAFSATHPLYLFLRDLSDLRSKQPALRYGRQYFRPIGDGRTNQFGYSPYNQGVLAFSRILNDREVLVVVNTHTSASLSVSVVVDANLHPLTSSGGAPAKPWELLFSTADPSAGGPPATPPSPTRPFGATRAVVVTLQPMEGQVLTGPNA